MDNKKLFEQVEYFENRVIKNKKHLLKWAKRNGVFCFRLYDKDIPEIPLCVDLYYEAPAAEGGEPFAKPFAVLTLYKRPYEKDAAEELQWLKAMQAVLERVFDIGDEAVFVKLRQKRSAAFEKRNAVYAQREKRITVQEGSAYFYIYFGELLDTGLFLDHRWLRRRIFETAQGKRVLNLFCYTGAFSVFAALAGAERVVSVDLSKNYLQRAKDNFSLNGLDIRETDFIAQDVFSFLKTATAERSERRFKTYSEKFKTLRSEQGRIRKNVGEKGFDIIVCDAPTFSNSKKTVTVLDINRDWFELCDLCLALLTADGVLYFSCNSKTIKIKPPVLAEFVQSFFEKTGKAIFVRDITAASLDEDFRNKKPHILLELRFVKNH